MFADETPRTARGAGQQVPLAGRERRHGPRRAAPREARDRASGGGGGRGGEVRRGGFSRRAQREGRHRPWTSKMGLFSWFSRKEEKPAEAKRRAPRPPRPRRGAARPAGPHFPPRPFSRPPPRPSFARHAGSREKSCPSTCAFGAAMPSSDARARAPAAARRGGAGPTLVGPPLAPATRRAHLSRGCPLPPLRPPPPPPLPARTRRAPTFPQPGFDLLGACERGATGDLQEHATCAWIARPAAVPGQPSLTIAF